MSYRRVVKVTLLIYKKPGTTDEEFAHYWAEVHGKKSMPGMLKHGVLHYSQTHTPILARQTLLETSGAPPGRILDCDGVATATFPTWEAARAWQFDEETKRIQKEDGAIFADHTRQRLVAGEEVLFIEDGKLTY
ncbi:MAG: hypothetical protein M1818_005030 [Claussenomyces sp. TS43310]|nr:MAG: hypothetical protein M1818_005030 [Claussenomyces sp. TS43310]